MNDAVMKHTFSVRDIYHILCQNTESLLHKVDGGATFKGLKNRAHVISATFFFFFFGPQAHLLRYTAIWKNRLDEFFQKKGQTQTVQPK